MEKGLNARGDTMRINLNAAIQNIHGYRKNGLPKGTSLGWPEMDKFLTVVQGQLNIVTGYSGSGKSEFIESVMINMAKKEDWRICVYSPESYPVEVSLMRYYEKHSGQPVLSRFGSKPLSEANLTNSVAFINSHFEFLDDTNEDIDLNKILAFCENEAIQGRAFDALVIDPWNELEQAPPNGMSETVYTGKVLRKCRKFARKFDLSFWILAHPTKPTKNKDGSYDSPNLYSISGSANWKNKADNGIIVHRPDPTSKEVEVTIEKVKNRLYGKPGKVKFEFQLENSCYNFLEDVF